MVTERAWHWPSVTVILSERQHPVSSIHIAQPAQVRLCIAALQVAAPLGAYLRQYCFPIRYGHVKQLWPIGYYQTVYASEPGSAEMSSADREDTVHPGEGWTSLVITPERGLRVVDGLLTGLHEPHASHLAMLEALAGARHL